MTKLQQKKTLQIVRQRPWVMMALRCYFNWQQPSKEQTRKHIENKSLGNQLKMARDQKLMKSSSFDVCTFPLLPSLSPKNAFKASFRIKPAIAKWG